MHILRIHIPIYDSVLCLAYSKVAELLVEAFPEAVIDQEWQEIGAYQRLEAFLRDSKSTSEATGALMLAQMRTTHIVHGPTCRFEMRTSGGASAITGSLNRWSVSFQSETAFSPVDHARIVRFLTSLGIGTLEESEEN